MISVRSKVQFLPGPQHLKFLGAVAQLGEHLLCKQGVVGSNPISSNITCAKYVASNLKFFENQITYIQSSLVRLRKLGNGSIITNDYPMGSEGNENIF